MIDVIILAGGRGTRMEDVIPKPLIVAAGKPIISHQLDYLFGSGKVRKVVLALGHKSGEIIDYVNGRYSRFDIDFSVEESPLGTAGSIKRAIPKTSTEHIIVLNCDDITDIDITALSSIKDNAICIAHPRLPFGLVVPKDGTVSFKEKPILKDWVSCGWYLFDRKTVMEHLPDSGSLEYDVFPKIDLKVYKHTGFWSPLNTKKDITDFEETKRNSIF